MKQAIKSLLARILPMPWYLALEAGRQRRFIQRLEHREGYRDLNLRYEALLGRRVRTGPFEGMEYTPSTSQRHITQRLIGCYESELHALVRTCLSRDYAEILDVGCAEGYYAVGFALKGRSACVHAFDTDPWARSACRALASQNGVEERLQIHGYCSPAWMRANLKAASLVISDCEGYEAVLFGEGEQALYTASDLLIELHDVAPSSGHPIARRFQDTHELSVIPSTPHDPSGYDFLEVFAERERAMAVDDRREAWQGWIFLRSKALDDVLGSALEGAERPES